MDPIARFVSHVEKGKPEDCWPWNGCRLPRGGYGRFIYTARPLKMILAHRFAWAITHGFLPRSCVLHSCDNPPCCNPNHLFLGTRVDNIRDMVSKKRQRGSPGERNNHYRLKCLDRGCRIHGRGVSNTGGKR